MRTKPGHYCGEHAPVCKACLGEGRIADGTLMCLACNRTPHTDTGTGHYCPGGEITRHRGFERVPICPACGQPVTEEECCE
jgi:hypothetical protein